MSQGSGHHEVGVTAGTIEAKPDRGSALSHSQQGEAANAALGSAGDDAEGEAKGRASSDRGESLSSGAAEAKAVLGRSGGDAEAGVASGTTGSDIGMSLDNQYKEVSHDTGTIASPAPGPSGIMSADDAGAARGGGASGDGSIVELRGLSSGVGATGVPAAPPPACRAFPESLAVAVGEDVGGLGPEAFAAEGGAAVAWPAGRGVRGPARECVSVWAARLGEDACPVRGRAGTGPVGPAGVMHQVQFVGAGIAGGQARPTPASGDQAP